MKKKNKKNIRNHVAKNMHLCCRSSVVPNKKKIIKKFIKGHEMF